MSFKGDAVSERFEFAAQSVGLRHTFVFGYGLTCGFPIGLAGGKDEENGLEEAVTDGDKGAFGAASGLERMVAGTELGITLVDCSIAAFGQGRTEERISFAGLAAEVFPGTFVVSRTHAGP